MQDILQRKPQGGYFPVDSSLKIKQKLDALGMVEDVDYLLRHVSEQVPSAVIYSSSKDQAR